MKLAHAYAAATIFLLGCIGVGHYVNVPTLRPTPQLQLQYIPSVTNLNFFAATDMLVDHGVRMYTPRAIPSTNRQNTVITEPPTTSSASEGAIREAIATTVFENIDSNPRPPPPQTSAEAAPYPHTRCCPCAGGSSRSWIPPARDA